MDSKSLDDRGLNTFYKRLKAAQSWRNCSDEELALHLGIRAGSLSTGRARGSAMSLLNGVKAARYLGVSIWWLVLWEGEPDENIPSWPLGRVSPEQWRSVSDDQRAMVQKLAEVLVESKPGNNPPR